MECEGVILSGRIPEEYRMELYAQERSEHTIIRYMPGLQGLKRFLGGAEVSKALMIRRKAGLGERCAPGTVNTVLAAANGRMRYLGCEGCCLRFMKLQRQLFKVLRFE